MARPLKQDDDDLNEIRARFMRAVNYFASKRQETATALLFDTGISQQTWHSIVTKNLTPSITILKRFISRFKEIDGHWLLTGQGEMLIRLRGVTDVMGVNDPAAPTHEQPAASPDALQKQVQELQADNERLRKTVRTLTFTIQELME